MTLSTDIYLTKYIPAEMVMQKLIEIINFPDYKYDVQYDKLVGEVGQGAWAWLFVYHNNGKPIEPADYETNVIGSDEVDKYGDPKIWCPKHYVRIDMDTSYGAGRGLGFSASDFHAYVIQELSKWQLDTELTFLWQNEFTSEIFEGLDGLADFGDPNRGQLAVGVRNG